MLTSQLVYMSTCLHVDKPASQQASNQLKRGLHNFQNFSSKYLDTLDSLDSRMMTISSIPMKYLFSFWRAKKNRKFVLSVLLVPFPGPKKNRKFALVEQFPIFGPDFWTKSPYAMDWNSNFTTLFLDEFYSRCKLIVHF
jgi:hypothetical protein